MKILKLYAGVIITIVLFLSLAMHHVESPEERIIGTWNEKSWEYEKVRRVEDLEKIRSRDTVSQAVKDELGKHLIIHSAEVWEFLPGGTLLLRGPNATRRVTWTLKGRGHILELRYANNVTEHYNLTELSNDKMVLNFDSDIQVKGVAKLSFNKTASHVKKI
jgi:hypothetical protein